MSKIDRPFLVDVLPALAVIISIPILGALEVLPAEAVIAVLFGVAGARVVSAGKPGGGKPPGGAVGAVVAGLAAILATRGLRS